VGDQLEAINEQSDVASKEMSLEKALDRMLGAPQRIDACTRTRHTRAKCTPAHPHAHAHAHTHAYDMHMHMHMCMHM